MVRPGARERPCEPYRRVHAGVGCGATVAPCRMPRTSATARSGGSVHAALRHAAAVAARHLFGQLAAAASFTHFERPFPPRWRHDDSDAHERCAVRQGYQRRCTGRCGPSRRRCVYGGAVSRTDLHTARLRGTPDRDERRNRSADVQAARARRASGGAGSVHDRPPPSTGFGRQSASSYRRKNRYGRGEPLFCRRDAGRTKMWPRDGLGLEYVLVPLASPGFPAPFRQRNSGRSSAIGL